MNSTRDKIDTKNGTKNLRYPYHKHKNNIYSNLYNDIGQIILKYMPDVMCLQEDVSPRPFSLNIGMFYNEIISCEAQKIDWIDSVNYMTNTIFVRNDKNLSVKTYRQCILPDGGFAPRCAVSVNVDGITISNTHLQGGRYVDEKYKSMMNLKSEEMTDIIDKLKPEMKERIADPNHSVFHIENKMKGDYRFGRIMQGLQE